MVTVQDVVPVVPIAEYRNVRKRLQGGANWIRSKLPEHEVTSKIEFELGQATLHITVELMGEDYRKVIGIERVACGDQTPWALPEICNLQERRTA